MQTLMYRVLAILRRDAADGNMILERLGELDTEATPSLPTLYRCLRQAMDEGWVEVSVAEDSAGPGRPPQIYRLTGAGLEAAREEARRLRDLAALTLRDKLVEEPGGEP